MILKITFNRKMGFVFNLEKWVFENLDTIKTYLIESNTLLTIIQKY